MIIRFAAFDPDDYESTVTFRTFNYSTDIGRERGARFVKRHFDNGHTVKGMDVNIPPREQYGRSHWPVNHTPIPEETADT